MGKQVKPLPLYEFDATTLTVNYQEINGVPYDYPVNYLKIINNSKLPVWISYDGTNDCDFVRVDSDSILDLIKESRSNQLALPKYLTVYIKSTAVSVGQIVMVAYTIDY